MMVIIPTDMQKDAYWQGACDYRNGVSMLDCPYSDDDEFTKRLFPLRAFYWQGGWWDERKKNPRKEDGPYEPPVLALTRKDLPR